jgi:hypothetical protein
MERLDDHQIHRRLLSLCDELSELADLCWSPKTGAVVRWLATVVRKLADALQS